VIYVITSFTAKFKASFTIIAGTLCLLFATLFYLKPAITIVHAHIPCCFGLIIIESN